MTPSGTTPIQPGELYAGYASDAAVRAAASSGGVVSAILLELLRRGHGGALVSRITSSSDGIVAETVLARTPEEVLRCGGSSYIDTPVLQAVHRLRDERGPIAVVALPCQVRALRRMMQRQPELSAKFFPVIGLFCRGSVRAEFYDDFFRSIGLDPRHVSSVKVARGHVKGQVIIRRDNGGETNIPFMRLNAYRLAGIHAKRLCAWCDEHMAAEADLSVGDIFTSNFKHREIKHSAFAARNERFASLVAEMVEQGQLTAERVGMDSYCRTFRKIERFSNQQVSRWPGAFLFGPRRPSGKLSGRFNLFHSLAWMIILCNGWLSRKPWGRRVLYAMPRPMVTVAALLVKGLSRL